MRSMVEGHFEATEPLHHPATPGDAPVRLAPRAAATSGGCGSWRIPPLQKQGKNEEGFSLVELMVVIVILGLLATIVIINVMPAMDRAAVTKVRADIDTLGQGIELYRLTNLRYPTSDEGLQVLVPGQIRRLPNDPWGNPYLYEVPGPDGAPFQISSLGADGREGGSGEDADITH